MKMKIIGHRGAGGLALENTKAALERGIDAGVDALEFDVHKTLDDEVVLSHDGNLERTGGGDHDIAVLTFAELQKLPLSYGKPVITLAEALQTAGTTPVIIEIKSKATVELVITIVERFPKARVTIASPVYDEIARLKELRPEIPGYIRVVVNPFDALYIAKAIKADGLDLNYWVINPLTYFMVRRANMGIMVYTVNNTFFGRFLHWFYPQAWICTNYPNRFIKKRSKKL
jgi:glycerophosphoryl diester phosphodiesterase